MHSNEEENEKLDIKIIILDIVGIILFLCAHFIPNLNNTVKIILYIIHQMNYACFLLMNLNNV